MNQIQRKTIVDSIDDFLKAWENNDRLAIKDSFVDDAVFESTAHGTSNNNIEIADLLIKDFSGNETSLFSSNHFIAHIPESSQFVTSFYVYGIIKTNDRDVLIFGATAIGHLINTEEKICFGDLKFSVNWFEGNPELLKGWNKPKGNRFWQPGDPEKLIVSEVDSPLHLYKQLNFIGTEEDLVNEFYAKYSWAIDQADFTLLSQMFADDAYGDFTPMGELSGKHQIIATLKEFRQVWPWMQHFGEGLKVELNPDKTEALLIVGRIIPQEYRTVLGTKEYGAHYHLKLIKTENVWKIKYFSYNPGWFSDISEII